MNIGDIERATQNRVIKLLCGKLGYAYLGNRRDRENFNVEDGLLHDHLAHRGYSSVLINKAVMTLHSACENQTKSLYEVNQDTYSLLRYGAKEKEGVGEDNETVQFVDWEDPLNNDFAVAEEVTVGGNNTKRPDIVLYVNGIALAVLELKRSTISVSEGIRQNIGNQDDRFIKPFFTTVGLVMAGNDSQGLRYGVINTPEKYYLQWKEDRTATDELSGRIRNEIEAYGILLDKNVISVCSKERILELLHDFVIFDAGVKKVCRPNQYFGVKAAQQHIRCNEGGIIWHTQGSGKSLTMVWLARWIKEHIATSRVLIITDREELDGQIEDVFNGVHEEIYRTRSGRDLIARVNDTTPRLMCSLVHKFGRHGGEIGNEDYDHFIEELKQSLPDAFAPKGDFFVFVDECHRTQSGQLHQAMKAIMKDAMFIGFTGTPLMKQDKRTSLEIFGPFIHCYKYDEAVKDGVILDLRYEARTVDQNITSQERVDEWFDAKTRGLSDFSKARLKRLWGTMQNLSSSKSRLGKIAADVVLDFATKDRLQNGRGNALLVANSIYEACKYYEIFQGMSFKKCAIVTSYEPNVRDIRSESVGDDGETRALEQYDIYQKMLNWQDVATFEQEAKDKFAKSPAEMKLLIVVDKLLTGFDAPPATYLYIDKSMHDHGLFQAICRVNRLDGEDKDFGHIVDYRDLFMSLESAIKDYTGAAFDNYDKEDVQGLLSDRVETGRKRLDETLEELAAVCEPVPEPRDTICYVHYFCGNDQEDLDELRGNEPRRERLYKLTASLMRAYADIAADMAQAGYAADETTKIRKDVVAYQHMRDVIRLASGDYVDLKAFEPDMRHLIDTYISADESRTLANFGDSSLLDLLVSKGQDGLVMLPEGIQKDPEAVAETIENNVRRKIVEKSYANPAYYEKMSALLKGLIDARKQATMSYEEYLEQVVELTRNVVVPETSANYPTGIKDSATKRALYDNLGRDEDLTNVVYEAFLHAEEDGFRSNAIKERRIMRSISAVLGNDEEKAKEIYRIICEQDEY